MDRLHAMRVFTRIVELGSFSRAAEQFNLTRATATQIVKKTEAHLGVRLLSRTTRQVTPTVDGDAYYQRCIAILNQVDEVDAEFRQASRQPEGRIRVDLSAAMCRLVLIPALPEFFERYPQIQLEVSVSDRPIDLIREGVDCVLRSGKVGDVDLIARPLGLQAQLTCASADYLARRGRPATLDALDGHCAVNYLSASSGKSIPFEFTVDGALVTRHLPASLALNSGAASVDACAAGLGLIQIPAFLVARQLASGEFVEVLPEHRPPPLMFSALYPPNRHLSNRVRVFIDWLAERFA